jgi:hypothetical protein
MTASRIEKEFAGALSNYFLNQKVHLKQKTKLKWTRFKDEAYIALPLLDQTIT